MRPRIMQILMISSCPSLLCCRTVFPIIIAAATSLIAFGVAFTPYQLLLPLAGLGGFFFGAHW